MSSDAPPPQKIPCPLNRDSICPGTAPNRIGDTNVYVMDSNAPDIVYVPPCPWWLPEQECCAVVGIAKALAGLPVIKERVTVQQGYMEGIAEGLRRLGDEIRNK